MAEEEIEPQTTEQAAPTEEQRRRTEQQRMKWAGILLAAIALFAGGFAVGQAAEDDAGRVAGDVVFDDELPPGIEERLDRIEERLDRFEVPESPRGPFGGGRFDLPDDFPCRVLEGDNGEFRLECDFEGDFRLPDRFDECPFFDGDCPWLDDGGDPDVTDRAGFLGVEIVDAPRGVVVQSVVEGSPAAEAGIEPRDVIAEFDGVEVESGDQLADLIAGAGAGATADVTLIRSGSEVRVEVELSGRPD